MRSYLNWHHKQLHLVEFQNYQRRSNYVTEHNSSLQDSLRWLRQPILVNLDLGKLQNLDFIHTNWLYIVRCKVRQL
jgi:hypothetical protein